MKRLLITTIAFGALVFSAEAQSNVKLTYFTPLEGPVNTEVTIIGSGFDSATAVTFNNNAAVFHVESNTKLTAWVPNDNASGLIKVWRQFQSATSGSRFEQNPLEGHLISIGKVNQRGQLDYPQEEQLCMGLFSGSDHSMLLQPYDTVTSWGSLPTGDDLYDDMLSLAGGSDFSLALIEDGTVRGWGDNGSGQITIPPNLPKGIQIAAGHYHGLMIDAKGLVYGWGRDDEGQVRKKTGQSNPRIIGANEMLEHIISIQAGDTFSLALRSDGAVIGWGSNAFGQLGSDGPKIKVEPRIIRSDLMTIAAGSHHVLGIEKGTRKVVAWGDNEHGQCDVPPEAKTDIIAIAAGESFSLALRSDGKLISWGKLFSEETWEFEPLEKIFPDEGVNIIASGKQHFTLLVSLLTLEVASQDPESGVTVTVSPEDWNGQGDGTTQFTRVYSKGTEVTLSAKQIVGVNQFKLWLKNEEPAATGRTMTVTMDYDRTLRAVYEPIPLTYKVSGDTVTITDCEDTASGALVIPSIYEGKPVTSIGDWAFRDCSGLTSVTIPNSVTSIGGGAFYNCSSLTSVTIGNSVTRIGDQAFYKCSSLTSVTIPDSVTSIVWDTFLDCSSLTSIEMGKSNTEYSSEDGVLFDKNKTELIQFPAGKNGHYTIPDSVTSIGRGAFLYCRSLTSVTIPNSVTRISIWAFQSCSSLTSVTIPDSVTSIERGAFRDCSSLKGIEIGKGNTEYSSEDGVLFDKNKTELIQFPAEKSGHYTIPESVTRIGYYAFFDCGLTSVTIPDSVTSIGAGAFRDCSSLTSVTIPDSVTSIVDYAFQGCSSLTSVTIGDSVTSIGKWAFVDCSSLTSVTIPDSVTSIGNGAFYNCSSLTSVTIGNSVTTIGVGAFMGCSSLTRITFEGNAPSFTGVGAFQTPPGLDEFYGVSEDAKIIVNSDATGFGESFAGLPVVIKPVITSQSISHTVTVGANVTFSVAASGTKPLSYRWQCNGVFLGPATDTPTLTLTNIQPEQAGTYQVLVSNVAGSLLSEPAALTILGQDLKPGDVIWESVFDSYVGTISIGENYSLYFNSFGSSENLNALNGLTGSMLWKLKGESFSMGYQSTIIGSSGTIYNIYNHKPSELNSNTGELISQINDSFSYRDGTYFALNKNNQILLARNSKLVLRRI